MGGPAPRCPLCLEWMEKEYEHVRGFFIFTCVKDKIACRVDDPFVGRWDEALKKSDKKILCLNPRCDETPMRYFATQIGFMKAKCPKCGATLSNAEPDRPKDTVHTPEKPGVLQ